MPKELKEEEDIVMAMDAMKRACADREVREMVRAREMARLEWNTQLEHATQKGRVEGELRGKQDDARKMREIGLDPETIFKVTGLASDQY